MHTCIRELVPVKVPPNLKMSGEINNNYEIIREKNRKGNIVNPFRWFPHEGTIGPHWTLSGQHLGPNYFYFKGSFFPTIISLTFSILVGWFTLLSLCDSREQKRKRLQYKWSSLTSCLHLRNIAHVINKRSTRDREETMGASRGSHAPPAGKTARAQASGPWIHA